MTINLLKDGSINIDMLARPERVDKVFITYTYELGTNHLRPRLLINDKTYYGDNIFIPLDLTTPLVNLTVSLLDGHSQAVHTYTGSFAYDKYCTVGPTKQNYNLYTYIQEIEKELIELKEKGEVI